MLTINDITKKYDNTLILNHVSLDLESHASLGLVGPNGAGKTTLLKCILGLANIQNGEIEIDHVSIKTNRKKYLQKINGFVEGPVFFENYTGYQNIKYDILGRDDIDSKWISYIIELFDVKRYLNKKVKSYSLGMKQRLGICRAFINKPSVLLLDEPTNGLDIEGRICFWNGIEKVQNEIGTSVIVSSHSIEELEQHISRFCFINHGEISKIVNKNEMQDFSIVKLDNRTEVIELLSKFKTCRVLSESDSECICIKVSNFELEVHMDKMSGLIKEKKECSILDEYKIITQRRLNVEDI